MSPEPESAFEIMQRLKGIVDIPSGTSDEVVWSIAKNYQKIRLKAKDPSLVQAAKKIAIRAIIDRTLHQLGPTKMPMVRKRVEYAPGEEGEIDVSGTLDNIHSLREINPKDIILERKELKHIACVLMIDASLSMTGEKLAMATSSIAVLAHRLKGIEYGVVLFENRANVIKKMDAEADLEKLIGDLLDLNAMGYTNIEEGLRAGINELEKAKTTDRIGIIVTDGNYTMGHDPRQTASLFPKLHVIMTTGLDAREDICSHSAQRGKGKMYEIKNYEEMPGVLYSIIKTFHLRLHQRGGMREK
ncbi:MAG: VWA domain-containing protein [Candidatus Thermoplasmatota archaeon]|nr:VWA domain-containing protein [Candidatus Thermoplasmatota archaeon]